MDFVIDGERLGEVLARELGPDVVPVLVTNWPAGFPADDFGGLVGEADSPLPDGRFPLYVCAECGDLGCSGVTAVIDRSDDTVVWRDLGYQDFEPFDDDERFDDVGPFVFDSTEYDSVLQRFRSEWSSEVVDDRGPAGRRRFWLRRSGR